MFVIGLNHKTTPIEIREKFYLNPIEQDLFLAALKANPAIAEAFVLSTCNRIEVYLKGIDEPFDGSFVLDIIQKIKKNTFGGDISPYIYKYYQDDALEHLLRVVTGLDSLVLGEKQILGQVKIAVERAREQGILSKYFNILTNIAIRTGKKAQHETGISLGGSSISWAAIEMAQQTLGTLRDKSILVIGAGKMGELALSHLHDKGVGKFYMMNRTGEKAQHLADTYGGIAASFMDIKDILSEVDICFCSVGAPHYILDKDVMSKIMNLRQGRPLAMIDISMPRNVDPLVATIEGITLTSIDDLDLVVKTNMQKRQEAIDEVETIITQKMAEFKDKWSKLCSLSDSDFFETAQS